MMHEQELIVEMKRLGTTSGHYTTEENICICLHPEKSLLWFFYTKIACCLGPITLTVLNKAYP